MLRLFSALKYSKLKRLLFPKFKSSMLGKNTFWLTLLINHTFQGLTGHTELSLQWLRQIQVQNFTLNQTVDLILTREGLL